MREKTESTTKQVVVSTWDDSKKYWMADGEYTGVVAGKDVTGGDYVISTGIIGPGSFIPDHVHKWEDQTFHVLERELEAKIGEKRFRLKSGDSIHCPRGVTHYMKNTGDSPAKLVSYIFPGEWAEEFMAETSRQNDAGQQNLEFIEKQFGVVYV